MLMAGVSYSILVRTVIAAGGRNSILVKAVGFG